jgi:hypothetical protein
LLQAPAIIDFPPQPQTAPRLNINAAAGLDRASERIRASSRVLETAASAYHFIYNKQEAEIAGLTSDPCS